MQNRQLLWHLQIIDHPTAIQLAPVSLSSQSVYTHTHVYTCVEFVRAMLARQLTLAAHSDPAQQRAHK